MSGRTIFLLSSDSSTFDSVAQPLVDRGHAVTMLRTSDECLSAIERNGVDLLVMHLPLPGHDPAKVLDQLRKCDPRLDIIVTGTAPDFGPAEVLERGAFEYVEDPVHDPVALLSAVGVALGSRRGDVQLRYLRQKDGSNLNFDALVGEHPSMRKTYDFVRRFCSRTSNGEAPTVLLLGETGTGKGLVAKCIHYNSARRAQPFVEVNCAAIPPSLIESELFGYERGAFTDAKSSRAGLFETADGGTLFLDEVGSLPIGAQAKLLIAIEEKRVRRLGGRQAATVNVQIIAAAHPVLREAVRQGEFRDDLYHRLNVLSVVLPPLRDRGEDKIRLAESFVAEFCGRYGMPKRRLSEEARERILSYEWPGNVRELRNQIERIILLSDDPVIHDWNFDRTSLKPPAPAAVSLTLPKPSEYLLRLPEGGMSLDALECDAIAQALERCGGNVSGAARFLSITRQTLMYRMKKHGIRLTERRLPEPSSRREDGETSP